MKKLTVLILIVLICASIKSYSAAYWTQPLHDFISPNALAITGSNVFIGTNIGVYLSTNNGLSWALVSSGFTNNNITCLAVTGSNVFAGTNDGIYLSTNNGSSWTPVNSGLSNPNVMSLACNGSNIFAGTFGGGVFLSTNNGSSWTPVNSGLSNPYIMSLACNGSNIFAGTYGSGVFLSTNNGSSWTPVNSGLTNLIVSCLSGSGSNIFAGTYGDGVFLSTNNGSSWTPVNSGLSNPYIMSLACNGSDIFAGTYGGGVFLSNNNGQSWTSVNSGLTNHNVTCLASSGTDIFAGSYGGGVFLSSNSSINWTSVTSGLTNPFVSCFTVNGTDIFAGTYGGGVFLSTNSGTNWMSVNSGLTNHNVTCLASSGTDVFAGSYGGVFLSINNGDSWTPVNSGLTNLHVTSLAMNASDIFAGTYGGVFLSTNNGESWTPVNSGLTNLYITSLAVNGSIILAGTESGEIFLSTNYGTSWRAVRTEADYLSISSFAFTDSKIFAGTYGGGILISTNNGENWTPYNTLFPYYSVLCLTVSGSNIFAGFESGGVYLSTNNGDNWSNINFGVLDNTHIWSILVNSTGILAGTYQLVGLSPTLTTSVITSITSTGAVCGGSISDEGINGITARGVCWNTTGTPTISDSHTNDGTGTGLFTSHITGLSPNTTYYVRAYAVNSAGSAYGAEYEFMTLSTEPSGHSIAFNAESGGTNKINLSFHAAEEITNCAGYIVLRKNGSAAPDATGVTDGVQPSGLTLPSGTSLIAVVDDITDVEFSNTGLTPNTLYSYALIPFNQDGVNPETYNYLTDPTIPSATARTNQVPSIGTPTNYPADFRIADVNKKTITLSWSDAVGETLPERYLIIGSGNGFDNLPVPVDGQAVESDDINNIFVKTVDHGTRTVSFRNLDSDRKYSFRIYPFTGTCENRRYKTDEITPAASTYLIPFVQASRLTTSQITPTGMTIGFEPGSGQGRLLIAKTTSIGDVPLTQWTAYSADPSFTGSGSVVDGSGKILYIGSGNSVDITDLTLGTTYYFKVLEYNGSGDESVYNMGTARSNPKSFTTMSRGITFEEFINGITEGDIEVSAIYPNPARDEVNLNLSITVDMTFDVRIYDINGIIIDKCSKTGLKLNAGVHSIRFDTHELMPGTYIIELNSGNEMIYSKIEIIR